MRLWKTLTTRRLFTLDFFIGAAIFLFAFALRWWGVRGSLPYVGHPDEPKLIDSAVHIIKSGDLNPHLYIWPSLYFYLEALVIKANVVAGTLRGAYAGPQSLPDISHIFSLATGVYVWARTLTAIVGATTVTLLYAVGKEMFNGSRRAGVAAALMLAVSPLHIEYSHYALTDVPLGLMGLLVLWASYRLSRTRPAPAGKSRWRDPFFWQCALCGLLLGLAIGTKYNGLYAGVVPLTAWFLAYTRGRAEARNDPEAARAARNRMFVSLAALPVMALLGFLLAEPYAVLDWPSFYSGFTFQVGAYVPARTLAEALQSVGLHVTDLSASDMYFFGPALLGAFVLMLSAPVRNRGWLLVPFPILYTLAMSRFALVYVRNLIITLPFLALISGYLIDVVVLQVSSLVRGYLPAGGDTTSLLQSRRTWDAVRWVLLALALALVIAEPLRVSYNYSAYMANTDSRNLAWQWVEGRMAAGDRFAAELHPWQTQDWPDVLSFDVENPGEAHPLTAVPPDWYAAHGYNLLVLNSNFKDNKRDAALWPLYQKLPVVKVFAGDKEGGKGPTVTVLASSQPPAQGGIPLGSTPKNVDIENFATLAGYDLAPLKSADVLLDPASKTQTGAGDGQATETYSRGQAIGLNLYLRSRMDGHQGDPNWQVWIHLVDPATEGTVAQLDVAPLTGQMKDYPRVVQQAHPVAQWHHGEFLAGVYNLSVPPNLTPGAYRLEAGMWVPPNGPGAKMTDKDGQGTQPPDRVVLGEINVR